MAQVKKTPQKNPVPEKVYHDDEEIIIYTPGQRNIYEKIQNMVERFATTRLGQFVIERCDRTLKTIEETAKWSLPKRDLELKPQRPLSWIPFLILILILRMLRIWLSFGAICIGNGPVTTNNIIYFIQTRRRKLRSIRLNGLKEMKQREIISRVNKAEKRSSYDGIMNSFRKLMSFAVCRPGINNDRARRIILNSVKMQFYSDKLDNSIRQLYKRKPDDDKKEIDQNLSIEQMLNKYADDSSGNDSDFNPDDDDASDTESNTSDASESGHSSMDEIEEENELDDVNKITSKGSNDDVIIKENGGRAVLPIIVKKEISSDPESNNQKTKENGPKTAQNEKQGMDVAKKLPEKIETIKLTNNTKHDNNMDASTDKTKLSVPNGSEAKTTPGHESAATSVMKPKNLLPIVNSTTAAASVIDFDKELYDKSTKSNTSATINIAKIKSTPPTPIPHPPTITLTRIVNTANHLRADDKLTTITPASSSEDIFYSPIGSPEYDAYLNNVKNIKQQPESNKNFNNEMRSNGADDTNKSSSSPVDNVASIQKRHVPYQTNSQRNQNDQHQYRYRGNKRFK